MSQGRTHGVIYPTKALAGDATGDDMLDLGVKGAKDFNFQAASGLPGPALNPSNIAVNIGEGVPPGAIREDVPTKAGFGLGGNRVLETKHTNATSYKSSPKAETNGKEKTVK
ncbi:MAG: hypothetical protein NVS9B14_22320 [Candidatus Acidiferrum sp.]